MLLRCAWPCPAYSGGFEAPCCTACTACMRHNMGVMGQRCVLHRSSPDAVCWREHPQGFLAEEACPVRAPLSCAFTGGPGTRLQATACVQGLLASAPTAQAMAQDCPVSGPPPASIIQTSTTRECKACAVVYGTNHGGWMPQRLLRRRGGVGGAVQRDMRGDAGVHTRGTFSSQARDVRQGRRKVWAEPPEH